MAPSNIKMRTGVSSSRSIPFHRPFFDNSEIEAVVECLRSGWLTTGPIAKRFEQFFARHIGAPFAIAVNSCTAAMHLALAALGIKSGDEVITTPYTFVSTSEAIQYLDARPVFVDIDPKTGNLDLNNIEKAVTARTRAIMPVHLAGYPCPMPQIQDLARKHDLLVVDDAAHALESELPEGKIGQFADATCFSFYATKNITTGEGGMVVCHEQGLADKIRQLSLHGLSRNAWGRYTGEGSWYYQVVDRGFKYNMPDIAAALGIAQLKKVHQFWRKRQEIACRYNDAFSEIAEVQVPPQPEAGKHSWHLYLLRLNLEKISISRAAFIEKMRNRGVHCSVHFIPLHLMPYYRDQYGFQGGEYPNAEAFYERVVSLPLYPAMSFRDVEYVIDAVQDVCWNAKLT